MPILGFFDLIELRFYGPVNTSSYMYAYYGKYRPLTANVQRLYAIDLLPQKIHNVPKFSDRQVWVNSAYPDQTAPDQGLHCLQFPLHRLDALLKGKSILFNF